MGAYVALVTIDLHFPDAGSLKDKRRELASLKALLHQRHGMSVAEVGHQDLWQRSTLAGAMVSGSYSHLEQSCATVQRFVDARCPQGSRVHSTLVSFDELEGLA